MNIDDPFASDLSNFDSIVAALETNIDKQQRTNLSTSSTISNTINNLNSRVRNGTNPTTQASSTPLSAMTTATTTTSRRTDPTPIIMNSSPRSLVTEPTRLETNAVTTAAHQEGNVHFLPTTSEMSSAMHGRRANASVPTNTNNNTFTVSSTSRIQPAVSVSSHATNNINNTAKADDNDDDNDPLAWLNDDDNANKGSKNTVNNTVAVNNVSNNNHQSEHEASNRLLATNNNVNNDEDDPLAFLEVKPVALTHSTAKVDTSFRNVNTSNGMEVPWEMNEINVAQPHKSTVILSEEEQLKAQKEKELCELRATLAALTSEVQQKQQALINRQEKEEAALLELEIKVCDKQNVITEESHKAEAIKEENERHFVQRKAEIAERLQKELKEQEEQMRREGELRYHRQLSTLFNQIHECEGRVAKMREERDLIMQRAPLSTQGVRLRLHKSIDEEHKANEQQANVVYVKQTLINNAENSNSGGGEHDVYGNKNEFKSEGNASETITKNSNNIKFDHANRLDEAVAIVVSLLQSCCNQRVDVMRKHTVDFIHSETLNVSGAIHNSRVAAFRNECNEHKSRLDKQINDTITNHRAFMKERQERNEAKLQSLRSTTQNAIVELNKRQEIQEEQLWNKFQDKITDMTTHFNTSALETASLFETKAAQVLLSNKNAALAEQAKLQKRFELEERVQRQLFQSQESTLQEQLSRMHQLSEAESARQLASMEKDLTQSRLALEFLANQINKFTSEMDGKAQNIHMSLQQDTNNTLAKWIKSEVSSHDNNTNIINISSKEIEELYHINQSLLHELEKRTNALLEQKSEIHNSQLRLLHMIDEECVQTFQTRQAAQHAAECEQNFIRTSWEKAYLQHLSMPFTLNIPVHVAHDKPLKFLQAYNLPGNEHIITPSTKMSDGSAHTAYLPITTKTEMTQTSVETYSPPALMTATALLDVIVTQLEEKTALEREYRNEITSCVRKQVEAVKELQAQSEHVHHSWIALLEQLHELDKERETVHQHLTHAAVETVKANCEEEKMRIEQLQLEQRRKELVQQLTLLKKEKKEIQVEYKDHIHRLRHMQLKMLCDQNMLDKGKCADQYALSYMINTTATSTASQEKALFNKLTNKRHDVNINDLTWNSHRGKNYYKQLRRIMSRTSTPTPSLPSANLVLKNHYGGEDNVNNISAHQKHYKEIAHERHRTVPSKQEELEFGKEHSHHHHRHTNNKTSSKKRRNASIDASIINNVKRDYNGKQAHKSICNASDDTVISNKRHEHKHKEGSAENKHNALRTFHSWRIHSTQSSPAAVASSFLTTEASSVQETKKRANSSSSSSSSSFSNSSSNTSESLLSSMQLLPPQLPAHRIKDNHDNHNTLLYGPVTHSHGSKQKASNAHHRRAASMHSCSHDESLCSSSSVYRVASFTDLLPLADSTNTSACTARDEHEEIENN